MTITDTEALQERFSLAVEDRSSGYVDLVSDANVVLSLLRDNGGWKTYQGPTIRERLMYQLHGSYVRYSGFEYLTPVQPLGLCDAVTMATAGTSRWNCAK